MLSYNEFCVFQAGTPTIFGQNQFFRNNTGHRGESKTAQFHFHVFGASDVRLSDTNEFKVTPAVGQFIPEILFSKSANKGFEVDQNSKDSLCKVIENVYFFVPENIKTIYGHWLIDILPNLTSCTAILNGIDLKIVYLENIPEFAVTLADKFGFPRSSFVKFSERDWRATSYIVAMPRLRDHDFLNVTLFKRHFVKRLSHIRSKAGTNTPDRRIYISRSKWRATSATSRSLLNRDDVERFFLSRDFEVVHPESMVIDQQIELFAQTKFLAGEAGSGLHNCVFMQDGSHVISLNSGRQNHLIQASLCYALDQESTYVVGTPESHQWNANYSIEIPDIESALSSVFSKT